MGDGSVRMVVVCLATVAAAATQWTPGAMRLFVAIHRDVSEHDFFLENLQRFLTQASRELLEVTGRIWLQSVTVQVPSTWPRRRFYAELDADFYQIAQVRVVPFDASPRMELLQPLPCGRPGQMLLVPDVLLNSQRHAAFPMVDFLEPEYEFVHLWPRLRYGIFDEVGIPGSRRFPMVVTDNDTVYPVSQAKGLSGLLSLPDGNQCAATPSGLLRPDCHLFLDLARKSTLRTLLRMPYAAAANPTAARYLPTEHNVLCQRKSTSEIIYSHEDFAFKHESSRPASEPEFRFVRPRGNATSRVVLLLDASEGMCRGGWMRLVHLAVSRFVQSRLPDGALLALAALAGDQAHVLANLTRIEARSRRQLRLRVPLGCGRAGVHPGRGLDAAAQLLNAGGGIVVLATQAAALSGKNETTTGQPDSGILLSTVALGAQADPALELLAARSGGLSFWVPSEGDALLLDDALADAAQQLASPADREIIVRREEIRVRGERQLSFLVDAALGKDANVAITGRAIESLAVRLRDPDDELYHETSPECTKDVMRTQSVVFSFSNMKPGRWTVQLSPGDGGVHLPSVVSLIVTSRARGTEDPAIQLRAQASASWVAHPGVASLHARLTMGPRVVLAASVWATVGRPRRRHVLITLHDDGLGADMSAADGVYSAFFTDHSGSGRYHVAVRAAGEHGSSVALAHACRSSLEDLARKPARAMVPLKKAYHVADLLVTDTKPDQWTREAPRPERVPCPMFERYVDAGSFQLVGYRERSTVGPGAVSDLLVEESTVRGPRWLLALSWTAMGAHLDTGAVDHLELRCSRRASELEEKFRRTVQIKESDLIRGSLSPLAARKRHELLFQVPSRVFPSDGRPFTVFFALKTQDVQGRYSPLSNVARATHPGMKSQRTRLVVTRAGVAVRPTSAAGPPAFALSNIY